MDPHLPYLRRTRDMDKEQHWVWKAFALEAIMKARFLLLTEHIPSVQVLLNADEGQVTA